MTPEELQKRVVEERRLQDYKWRKKKHTDEKWCNILTEEVGEVAQSINMNDTTKMKTELVQCAAVIQAWLEQRED